MPESIALLVFARPDIPPAPARARRPPRCEHRIPSRSIGPRSEEGGAELNAVAGSDTITTIQVRAEHEASPSRA